MPKSLSFLCNADLSIPTNFAVLDIFPLNFFNCEVKYSLSKFSLASLRVNERFSEILNSWDDVLVNYSLIISLILYMF